MALKDRNLHLPRPWYISLTAVWHEAKDGDSKLRTFWDEMFQRDVIADGPEPSETEVRRPRPAGHHVLIPQHCWHFTVLAVMRFNGYPRGCQNMREFAGRVFKPLRDDTALHDQLSNRREPFTAAVDQVRCFDDGITLHFDCGKQLEDLRNHARKVLNDPVSELVRLHTKSRTGRDFKKQWDVPLVQSILDDPDKNYGTRAFGSIARSPSPSDGSNERWRQAQAGLNLEFHKIHLLVSDEALTNPRDDEEDVPIPLRGA